MKNDLYDSCIPFILICKQINTVKVNVLKRQFDICLINSIKPYLTDVGDEFGYQRTGGSVQNYTESGHRGMTGLIVIRYQTYVVPTSPFCPACPCSPF